MFSWKNITVRLKDCNIKEAINLLEDLDVVSFNITEKKNMRNKIGLEKWGTEKLFIVISII